ncbi:restriction endonuclease subunit S [Streptococcus danieliae]|nr:restriction endonuclease subunit S [Streptococcus danieliae]
MGSHSTSATKRRRYFKKSLSPRLQKLEDDFVRAGGEWREVKVGDLFEIRPTKNYGLTNQKLFETTGTVPVVVNSSLNNGIGGYVNLEPTEKGNMITFSDTTTTDSIFYQPRDFIGYSHVQGMYPFEKWNKYGLLYFVISFRASTKGKFDYGNKFNREKAKEILVHLPFYGNKIAFSHMDKYMKTLEAERIETLEAERIETLEAYLTVTGLKDYHLTEKDEQILDRFANLSDTKSRVEYLGILSFSPIKMKKLFPEIHQGRRLRKDDQVEGDLPFIMAGTTNTGFVGRIGNNVRVFPRHSLTIDIFGNTFYRSYEFGAGDDTGVFWNGQIDNPRSLLFIQTIIGKSLSGKYDFGHKLRASQTHDFEFNLPVEVNKQPDYIFMSDFIRVIEKLVIRDLVEWTDKKIKATKEVVGRG